MSNPKPTRAPRAEHYDDVTALARCTSILKRVESPSDRSAVANFLARKFVTFPGYPAGSPPPSGLGE